LRPRSVTGDAAYGTVENVVAAEKAGIRAYVVLPKHDERGPLFAKSEFVYDAEKDLYACPRGEALRRQGLDYKERSIRYAASPPPATRAPSRPDARKARRDAGSGAASRRGTSKGCAATATPSPTARR